MAGTSLSPGGVAVIPDSEPLAPPDLGSREQPSSPVEASPVEPRREPPPAEVERPARPRVATRTVRPARPPGKFSIYFDADSSTFDRGKNRAPLRVEVYVDGRKVMDSDDPEKKEFELADLPEGVHDVSIVPHVGNAQPRTRRFRVEVEGNAETRVEAVLRRKDGEALISKLRARD